MGLMTNNETRTLQAIGLGLKSAFDFITSVVQGESSVSTNVTLSRLDDTTLGRPNDELSDSNSSSRDSLSPIHSSSDDISLDEYSKVSTTVEFDEKRCKADIKI